jgi:hypothetical protein
VTERTLPSSLPGKAAKLVKKGEEGLEDLELDIDALRYAVIHRLSDARDGTEEGGEEDEALGLADGDRCCFGAIHHETHRHEAKEGFRHSSVCQIVQYGLFLVQFLYTSRGRWCGRAIPSHLARTRERFSWDGKTRRPININ